ncbi:hypothetical protein RchiOBHm_Chr6g0268501 [Rosa chinensis]|uniref:Uncharacterized protein n=1 Tax=Rosa chinensis TaxID=74649 RepID=A0A2P6PQA7_ROSCH|nr:hypothetical protein RchiOBHm_Chr6g0268501 [Rosa chinensis]
MINKRYKFNMTPCFVKCSYHHPHESLQKRSKLDPRIKIPSCRAPRNLRGELCERERESIFFFVFFFLVHIITTVYCSDMQIYQVYNLLSN